MGTVRIFEYVGAPALTRGDYGVSISGGHTRLDDPEMVYVFDPDFGDMPMCWVEDAEAKGFVFSHEEEWESDPVLA